MCVLYWSFDDILSYISSKEQREEGSPKGALFLHSTARWKYQKPSHGADAVSKHTRGVRAKLLARPSETGAAKGSLGAAAGRTPPFLAGVPARAITSATPPPNARQGRAVVSRTKRPFCIIANGSLREPSMAIKQNGAFCIIARSGCSFAVGGRGLQQMCAVLLPQDRTFSFLGVVTLYHTLATLSSLIPRAPAGAPPSASASAAGRPVPSASRACVCAAARLASRRPSPASPVRSPLAPVRPLRCAGGLCARRSLPARLRRSAPGRLGRPAGCSVRLRCAWRPVNALAASPLGWRPAGFTGRP